MVQIVIKKNANLNIMKERNSILQEMTALLNKKWAANENGEVTESLTRFQEEAEVLDKRQEFLDRLAEGDVASFHEGRMTVSIGDIVFRCYSAICPDDTYQGRYYIGPDVEIFD